ncbi:MAG: DegT/DnrJ/EryC1/StrS family aminotransferase [Candidatus Brocadiae bacterium]|nr:DegT/DnrJ/EryC1/StrS family aminotransferase [Candidatus Brocadiia bacterium]
MNRIYYTKPSITQLEVQYATDAATNGWGEKCYDYINKFEALFAQHLGTKYAIATSSCTGAIHLGLVALGIKPDDEIIIADTNWIATVAPITYLFAKPVFVDILPDTWCIDPDSIRKAITPKTKAIYVTHLYGNLCEMDEILDIAQKHGLSVIEDAAEGIGSVYKGKKAGSIGDFGTFSFHGTKTITTGEGGMFVTNRKDLYDTIQILNSHGRNPTNPKQFWCEMIGYKYKMSNMQAAIGCAQMERIEELILRKREIFSQYQEGFQGIQGISMNPEKKGTKNGYWMPTIVCDKSLCFDREKLLKKFKENNIDGRSFFYPLSMMPMFEEKRENAISYDIYGRAVNLPSYHDITQENIITVVDVVKKALKGSL